MNKPLGSRWVVVHQRLQIPPNITKDVETPKYGGDVIKLFAGKTSSPAIRRYIQFTTTVLDRITIEVAMKDRKIVSLREKVEQANLPKYRKSQSIQTIAS